MDIVIPLGNGSKCNDFELLYCLRGIEKHLSNWDKIYIIGRLPIWLVPNNRLVFIPFVEDQEPHNREINILKKIKVACRNAIISNDFLLMNDDHFLLTPCSTENIPYYFQYDLTVTMANRGRQDEYFFVLKNTLNFLQKLYLPTNDFDIHCPIIYNKEKFKVIFSGLNIPTFGFAIKSMYANNWCIPGEQMTDCKFKFPVDTEDAIYTAIKNRPFFSVGDAGLTTAMFDVLKSLYPAPSTFEGH